MMMLFSLLPGGSAKWNSIKKEKYSRPGRWGNPESKIQWSINLTDFQLYQEMEKFIPQLFNPRFDLSFLAINWDDERLWKVMPQEEEYSFFFGENNTRYIKKKNLLLFRETEVNGNLNILVFLLKNGLHSAVRNQLIAWVARSDLALEFDKDQEEVNFIIELAEETNRNENFCLPLLRGILREEDFEKSKNFRIEENTFSLQLDFLKSQ